MIIWIMTDMEGLSGVDQIDQFSPEDEHNPAYQYGREQLTADANAAILGCFDAGATEVRICDGHGFNRNRGFTEDLDPRATKVHVASRNPIRWEGLDESVHAIAMIGQHAMAGTVNAFLDHTQSSKVICRYFINGEEAGEMSQITLYAGGVGAPLLCMFQATRHCVRKRRGYFRTPYRHLPNVERVLRHAIFTLPTKCEPTFAGILHPL